MQHLDVWPVLIRDLHAVFPLTASCAVLRKGTYYIGKTLSPSGSPHQMKSRYDVFLRTLPFLSRLKFFLFMLTIFFPFLSRHHLHTFGWCEKNNIFLLWGPLSSSGCLLWSLRHDQETLSSRSSTGELAEELEPKSELFCKCISKSLFEQGFQ